MGEYSNDENEVTVEEVSNETIYLDPVNVPETERFAIINHQFIEEGYGQPFAHKDVVSFYDRKTRVYCTIDHKNPDIRMMVDYNEVFCSGYDGIGSCPPIDECELLGIDRWNYRLIKELYDAGLYDNQPLDEASGFMKDLLDFENGLNMHEEFDKNSPLSALPDGFENRNDWAQYAFWSENRCEDESDAAKEEAFWEEYFSKKYQWKSVQLKMNCAAPKKVIGLSIPDCFVLVRKFRKEFPNLICVSGEDWDDNNAVFVIENDEQENRLYELEESVYDD